MSLITDCQADECERHECSEAVQRESKTCQEIDETYYTDGANDAAFGRLPVYAHEAYLEGYVAQLKKQPRDESGKIQHYSPRQHFAFGWMDGVGDYTDGESNYDSIF